MIKPFRLPAILLAIIAAGAFLRVQDLGKACLWLDETITYDRAVASIPEIIRASYGWEVHPPTYYLILHFMVKLGESAAALRMFSVICGVLSIPIFYLLGREILGKREAAVAALLLALSAYQIRYSQEARMYTLFFFVSALSILFFYRAFTRQQKRDWLIWAGVSVANFYVHYYAVFLIAAQFLFYAGHLIQQKTYRRLWPQHRLFLLACLIVAAACLPQIPFMLEQAESKRVGGAAVDWSARLISNKPAAFLLVFLKTNFYPTALPNPLLERGLKYLIGAFMLLGLVLAWKQNRRAILFLSTLLFVPLLCAWVVSFFIYFSGTFRYLFYLNAPLLLLFTLAITTMADKIAFILSKLASRIAANPEQSKAHAIAVVLGLACVMDSYVLANYYRNPRNADWQTGFSYIKKNCREGDAIVPVPGYVTYVARYFLLGDASSGRILWVHGITPQVLDSLSARHTGAYFILTGDFDNAARKEIEAWLSRQAKLVWQDPNFPTNAIWFMERRRPASPLFD
jgi:uncharacterized membrane protein